MVVHGSENYPDLQYLIFIQLNVVPDRLTLPWRLVPVVEHVSVVCVSVMTPGQS